MIHISIYTTIKIYYTMKYIKIFEEWKSYFINSEQTINESTPHHIMNHIMVELENRNILFDNWRTAQMYATIIEGILHKILNSRELKKYKKTIIKDKLLMNRIANIFIHKVKDARKRLSKKGIVSPKEMDLQSILTEDLQKIIDDIKILLNNI